jgi:hypothetical protein
MYSLITQAGLNIILMLGLDVVLDDVMSRALLSPVANDDGWAADDLPGLALGIQLAKAGPLAQLLVGVYLDDGDLKTTKKKLDSMFLGLGRFSKYHSYKIEFEISVIIKHWSRGAPLKY